MKYLSIDIETTGLNPEKHQMIEFAAVLEDTSLDIPVDKLPYFNCLIKHHTYSFNEFTLNMHTENGLIKKLIESKVTTCAFKHAEEHQANLVINNIYRLSPLFLYWLNERGLDTDVDKIVVAGKNFYGFDFGFLKSYLDGQLKLSHRAIDPAVFFIRDEDEAPPNLAKCMERAGIEFKGSYHTALTDALAIVELTRKALNNG